MSKYVVIDLEMCNVPKSKQKLCGCKNEIIEIGAVLIDDSLEITDNFKTFVSPEYGILDSYISRLTGIKAQNLKGAPVFSVALDMLLKWIPEGAVVVTWSDSDEKQIRTEANRKGISFPVLDTVFKDTVDCQAAFSKEINSSRAFRLSDALNIACVEYDEHLHEAYADAYNTALLFIKMKKESPLKLSSYYLQKFSKITHYNPFSELLGEFGCAV